MTRHVEVEQARGASGLRLVVTRYIPVPWCEAAKGILFVKGLPSLWVSQYPGRDNDELASGWESIRRPS